MIFPESRNNEKLVEFERWLGSDIGKMLRDVEESRIEKLLPNRYFSNVVQFGMSGFNVVDSIASRCRISVGTSTNIDTGISVVSDLCSLPFGSHCIDLAILPHTLDFLPHPHRFLRELTQAIVPDGTLLLTGFQPYSLWGIAKLLRVSQPDVPWSGKFLSVSRIQDWLSLMGYRIQAGGMTMYRPPIKQSDIFNKLAFLEAAGDRWWPMFGAVYIIVAQLETRSTISVSRKRVRHAFAPSIVQVRRLSAKQR